MLITVCHVCVLYIYIYLYIYTYTALSPLYECLCTLCAEIWCSQRVQLTMAQNDDHSKLCFACVPNYSNIVHVPSAKMSQG